MATGLVNLAALIVVICGAFWLLCQIGDILNAFGFYDWLERRQEIQKHYDKKGKLSPLERINPNMIPILFWIFGAVAAGLLYLLLRPLLRI